MTSHPADRDLPPVRATPPAGDLAGGFSGASEMTGTIIQYPGAATFAAGPESGDGPGYVRQPGSLAAGGFSAPDDPHGALTECATSETNAVGALLVQDWHRIQLAAIAKLSAGELQGWSDLVTGGKYGFRRNPFPGEIAALMDRARVLGVTLGGAP